MSRVADGFRCRRCDGTIQEVDLAEDLMVDGETYECVKSFCYLGDTLDGDGGADLSATVRIRNGWMKFQELLPFLTSRAPPLEMKGQVYASCVRSSMTYGSETRPLLVDVGLSLKEIYALQCNNCRVSHPGTLLEYPTFLQWELGKSLDVPEQVQTDWFFSENSNYKTTNTDDKLAFRFNGFGHNISTYIHHLCI